MFISIRAVILLGALVADKVKIFLDRETRLVMSRKVDNPIA
jgi:hypothetical protein